MVSLNRKLQQGDPHGLGVSSERSLLTGVKGQVSVRGVKGGQS